MAKQVGPLFVTGTIDGIIFYKLGDTYYMRSKGDYKSGKMMRKDPRLKRTMEQAAQFGVASKIVKRAYYRHLPKEERKPGLFAQLTGRVKRWLQEGKTAEEAREALIAYLETLIHQKETAAAPAVKETKPVAPQPASSTRQAKPAMAKPMPPVKQARYLSRWKVKRNGRLQVPKEAIQLLFIQPVIPCKVWPLKE